MTIKGVCCSCQWARDRISCPRKIATGDEICVTVVEIGSRTGDVRGPVSEADSDEDSLQ